MAVKVGNLLLLLFSPPKKKLDQPSSARVPLNRKNKGHVPHIMFLENILKGFSSTILN